MNKTLILIIVALVVAISLCACQSNDYPDNESTHFSDPVATSENTSKPITMDDYEEFLKSMESNPIDQDYRATSTSSSEYTETSGKYSRIWSEELLYTCQSLMDIYDEKQIEEFRTAHNKWFLQLKTEMEIMRAKDSAANWEYEQECNLYYAGQIRQRTLYLKYLLEQEGKEIRFLYVPNDTVNALVENGIFNFKDFEALATATHRDIYGTRDFEDISTKEKALAAGTEVLTSNGGSAMSIFTSEIAIALDEQAGVWIIYSIAPYTGTDVNYFAMLDRTNGKVLAVWKTFGIRNFEDLSV